MRVVSVWHLVVVSQGFVIYTHELLVQGTLFMGLIYSKYCEATGHLNGVLDNIRSFLYRAVMVHIVALKRH